MYKSTMLVILRFLIETGYIYTGFDLISKPDSVWDHNIRIRNPARNALILKEQIFLKT